MRYFKILSATVLLMYLLSISLAGQDTTLTITSEGNVGIGITNPTSKLHVGGAVQFDKVGPAGRLILHSVNRNDPGRWGIRFTNNGLGTFEGDDTNDINFSFMSGWGKARTYDAILHIHGKAANSWGTRLTLTHDGTDGIISTDAGNILLSPGDGSARVGIGTLSPIDKLEVEGGPMTIDGADGLSALRFRQADDMKWTFLTAEWLGTHDLRLRNETSGNDVMTFDTETNNVGIGTTTPGGTLDVNGTIYQRGTELHADYVFEPDYQLESIDDHSKFMWTNKHLKAIPKARTDDQGREIVEVGSHSKGIVEELEKAHIYIDQLHIRMKMLEEKIEKLSSKIENK
jgi:hypothetical protein